MEETEIKLILKCLRWLIVRDSMKPEFREVFDNSLIGKIDKLLARKDRQL